MTPRTRLLLLALCLVASVALFVGRYLREDDSRASDPATHSSNVSAAFAGDFERIRKADKIADVGERCLSYPDPDWLHWNRDVIEAFCRTRSFHHLELEDIQAALAEKHPEQVEQAFASYFADNFETPAKRGILVRVYREVFSSSAPEVRDVVERWVDLAPKSAFALAARGTYYFAAAQAARGEAYAKDTPGESFENMRTLAAKAKADLEGALRKSPRLIAAYDALIFVGRLTSDRELVDKSIRSALALDPADERFYLDWMAVSEPRWGGSLDEMEQVDKAAQQHVAENPLIHLVTEKKLAYYGNIELDRRDYAAALKRYEAAFAVGPSPVDLSSAGYAASMLEQSEKAVWFYSQAFRFDALNADSLSRRAFELQAMRRPDLAAESIALAEQIKTPTAARFVAQGDAYWKMGRTGEAAKSYRAALKVNPREERALSGLASVDLLSPETRADAKETVATLLGYYPDHAHPWYLSAMVAEDDAECLAALKRYVALVDQDDPYETEYVVHAKALIAEREGQVAPKEP